MRLQKKTKIELSIVLFVFCTITLITNWWFSGDYWYGWNLILESDKTTYAVNDDVVMISAGLKSEAVIPIEQFQNDQGEANVSVGDEFEVALDAVEDGFGETKLSREKAVRARTWIELEKSFEKSEVVTGIINGRVKGGFTVEIDNVRAFLPGGFA